MNGEYFFSESRADRACKFIERVLMHTIGEWAGKLFILEDWQKKEIIAPLFGWIRPNGARRYRTGYISMGRKNGKSELGAAIALYLLFADEERGGQVYSAAKDRRQASVVFDVAAEMVRTAPVLRRRSQTYKANKRIVDMTTRSIYEALSADVGTKHGLNASGVVFDELHTQPHRDLWDVMKTSMGVRRQPLMVGLTTAGYDRQSICFELYQYAKDIEAGRKKDDTFFHFIREAPEDADWTLPETWRIANPALGRFLSEETMAEECERAKQLPAFQNTFRNLYLNQWVQQRTRALDMHAWGRCHVPEYPDLTAAVGYGALDLSETTDITAFAVDVPWEGRFYTKKYYWLPGDGLRDRARRDGVDYETWAREGLIKICDGPVVDYLQVVAGIVDIARRHNIQQIAFDRWGTLGVWQALEREGFEMVRFGQGYGDMSAPTKEFLTNVAAGKVAHDNNPVTNWQADCLELEQDSAGNVKPSKPDRRRASQRIDGIVAGIMAHKLAIASQAKQEEPGII